MQLKRKTIWRGVARFSIALIAFLLLVRLSVDSVSVGIARFCSMLAIIQARIEPADVAIKWAPADPEAHYTRALTLVNYQRLPEAVVELRTATSMRPHHYYEWLDLGLTLDRLNDRGNAIQAIRESIRLAPSFSQPHWQLGNLLFREGQYDEAFQELRLGAQSNPGLENSILELAWVASEGNVGRFLELTQPKDQSDHFAVARFLAGKGKGPEAVAQIREAGPPLNREDTVLQHQTISELLSLGSFSDAFEIWVTTHGSNAHEGQILNGDFLEPIRQDDPGFGWQPSDVPNVALSIDSSGPTPGTRSLRVEFAGESSPWSEIIRQLVLVPANSHYSLSFSAKADNLVSGGPPVVMVMEGGSKPPKTLGRSNPIPAGSSAWVPYNADFVTTNTSAIVILIQRVPCNQGVRGLAPEAESKNRCKHRRCRYLCVTALT
jgi:hypothetical protein